MGLNQRHVQKSCHKTWNRDNPKQNPKPNPRPRPFDPWLILITLLPVAAALCVWLTPLAFVPVPWPDDSAFYFVAKEFFHWPPRWVMLPQAPFEPTYRIFNFNTMPLFPILIGLGRWVGIDGSFLLKLWPLGAWALSACILLIVLRRKGLPLLGTLLVGAAFCLDPAMRWNSVLVRPESWVGLFGMCLVLGLTFGFPARLQPRNSWDLWDPISALLALAAYSHFNAIHLVFPVLFRFWREPRRCFEIGGRTLLYLAPWIFTVFFHWELFIQQMTTQWSRLSFRNPWLATPDRAIASLFQSMGSPEPWPPLLRWAGFVMWMLIAAALFLHFLYPILYPILHLLHLPHLAKSRAQTFWSQSPPDKNPDPIPIRDPFSGRLSRDSNSISNPVDLRPVTGWIVGAIWLWDSKPEVWFIYYIHLALWCYAGLALLTLWHAPRHRYEMAARYGLSLALLICMAIFGEVNWDQYSHLSQSQSWKWSTYYDFVDCVDQRLSKLASQSHNDRQSKTKPFQVWCPTFPDITIELSRRHPDWEITRTNDFLDRSNLAIQHGWETDAVVVTETFGMAERTLSGEASHFPRVHSVWMHWKPYFLNQLWMAEGWKPNRFVCQRGRWQGFLFMNSEKISNP